MVLLQPSYLWGLLALAIPITIHLWSRKRVRTIKVGSTQFIAETVSKQSSSIQLNEWWLLLLRCLIISTLVLILAEPQSSQIPERQEIAYVFEPSLVATVDNRSRFKNIPFENRRLLMPSFPKWDIDDEIVAPVKAPNYWQLAQQLEEIQADSIVVFTHAFAKALQGKRPELKANIHWVPVDTQQPTSTLFSASKQGDSIAITTVKSDAHTLAFEKMQEAVKEFSFNSAQDSITVTTEKGVQMLSLDKQETLRVDVVYDEQLADQRVFVEAALRAIGQYTKKEIIIAAKPFSQTFAVTDQSHIIWLSERALPKGNVRLLSYRPDDLAKNLIELAAITNTYTLSQKLTPEVIVKEKLVQQLMQWLLFDKEIEASLSPYDLRVVSVNQLEGKTAKSSISNKKITIAAMSDSLWMLLLILIIGERLLSKIRKQ